MCKLCALFIISVFLSFNFTNLSMEKCDSFYFDILRELVADDDGAVLAFLFDEVRNVPTLSTSKM